LIAHRRLFIAFAALLMLALALPAAGDAKKKKHKPAKLTVMTRNVYLGGDISKPLLAQNLDDFKRINGQLWDTVQKTDFPTRSKALAKEIGRAKPDLVGLQEVAIWRRSPDGQSDGMATPSTIVVYDFLKSLQKSLKARGLKYKVGSVKQEADVEGPTDKGYDIRLTMRDVILVKKRKGLAVKKKGGKNYKSAIELNTVAGPVKVLRGYTYVDAVYNKRKFRFVDTHLESFLEQQRVDQAKELVSKSGPTKVKKPVIVVGDMNSDPNNATGASPVAYDTIRKAGFKDAWITIKGKKAKGYACCLKQEDIMDPPPGTFDHRIDHIFTKPKIKGSKALIVGTNANERINGLWPSDHGGWAATLTWK
jgi:endonuclease/exonuclease/phosphatase family metal-dependent hydrolase